MSDEPAPKQISPWTVKGMPEEDRVEINRAAKRADMNVGEWLKAAAALKIQAERNGLPAVLPLPDQGPPEAYQPAGSLAVVLHLRSVFPGHPEEAEADRSMNEEARRTIKHHLRLLRRTSGHPREDGKS